MNQEEFWLLIDVAGSNAEDSIDEGQELLDELENRLESFEPDVVLTFHKHVQEAFWKTFHWDVIAAGMIILGESADELDIDGFRARLISLGKEKFDAILANPELLADMEIVPDDLYLPEMLSLAPDVYEEITGEEIPEDIGLEIPNEPSGADFQLGDLPTKFPRLCEKYDFDAGLDDDEDDQESEADDDDELDALFSEESTEEDDGEDEDE